MGEMRLGDVIDDHCVKCRRITNHSIVSVVDGRAAKVRCRTCYHDHDYRHEQAPPTKKELKRMEAEALAAAEAAGKAGEAAATAHSEEGIELEPELEHLADTELDGLAPEQPAAPVRRSMKSRA